MTGPPTRAERKREELRRDIIDTAFDVFSERGYHASGIADIATRLGIGHGTVYRYFSNKRDILDHVVQSMFGRALSALTAENAPEAATNLAEYRAQSYRVADALYDLFYGDTRTVKLLFQQSQGVDQEMADAWLEVMAGTRAIIATYLEHGRGQGFLRQDLNVNATAAAILGLIYSGAMFALRRPEDRAQHQAYVKAAVSLVYEGIAPPATA